MNPAARFGLLLCHKRLLAGMSQEQLAAVVGFKRTEISILERGLQEPRLDRILRLAAAVETEPAELVAGICWVPGVYEIAGGYVRGSARGKVDENG